MAYFRPGGFSDNECSDEDEFAYENFDNGEPEPSFIVPTGGDQDGFGVPVTSLTTNINFGDGKAGAEPLYKLDTSAVSKGSVKGRALIPPVWSATKDELVNFDDLRLAVIKNHVEAVRKLLAHGIDVNTPFNSGWTALMYASHQVSLQCVDCLLEYSANPNAHKDGYTALMAACGSTTQDEALVLECVSKLIEAGAEVNSFDSRHHTSPLMYAAREGRASVVDKLIPLTDDIDQQDNKGYTALMWAVNGGHTHVVNSLLLAGANASKCKTDGKTAADIATAKRHQEIMKLLKVPVLSSADDGKNSAGTTAAACSRSLDAIPPPADGALQTTVHSSPFSAINSRSSSTRAPHESSSWPAIKPFRDNEATSQSGSTKSVGSNVPAISDPLSAGDSAGVSYVRADSQPTRCGSSGAISFGELEIFLCGIDMPHLIPVFHKHEISFAMFLRLTDIDLQKMGIEQLGVRKKILDAIRETHKKNWEASSLPSVQYDKKISCSEAVVMIANIRQHAAYIASTTGYISDQINKEHKIVLDAPQDPGISVRDLCINVEEAMTNVQKLYGELVFFRRRLERICLNRDFKSPELVPIRRKRRSSFRWRRLALFGVFLAGCTTAFFMFKKDPTVE